MSLNVPHKQEPANDNAGERCPFCRRFHAELPPDELLERAEYAREQLHRDFADRSKFTPWPLDHLPPSLRGAPGCPFVLGPIERAIQLRAQRESDLIALAHERPSLAPVVASVIESSASALRLNELEALSRAAFKAPDVLAIYASARRAADELERDRFTPDERGAVTAVAESLASLRRRARAQAVPADEWPREFEEWLRGIRDESQRFQRWIASSLPAYRVAASDRDPSARELAAAMTGQRDDGDAKHRDCPFDVGFKTVRTAIQQARKVSRPLDALVEEQLARAIVDDATRGAATTVDNAASW